MFTYCTIDVKINYLKVIVYLCFVIFYGHIYQKPTVQKLTLPGCSLPQQDVREAYA